MAAVRAEHPQATVQLWAEDEARFGLQPTLRRVWAKRGERPIVQVKPGYQWFWSYGAVEPKSGDSFWLILPNLQATCVEIFLAEFARAQGVGAEKVIVLLWDGAPSHRSGLKVPPGIELIAIPPYTPELNPSERLWSPLRESVANESFASIIEMEDVVAAKMNSLAKEKEVLSSRTNYHWLPPY